MILFFTVLALIGIGGWAFYRFLWDDSRSRPYRPNEMALQAEATVKLLKMGCTLTESGGIKLRSWEERASIEELKILLDTMRDNGTPANENHPVAVEYLRRLATPFWLNH